MSIESIELLNKWAKYIEERAQELGHEVEKISELYENGLERMMTVQLAHKDFNHAYRLELHIKIHYGSRIRLSLIQNIYTIGEENPFWDMDESIKESIELLFKKIKKEAIQKAQLKSFLLSI